MGFPGHFWKKSGKATANIGRNKSKCVYFSRTEKVEKHERVERAKSELLEDRREDRRDERRAERGGRRGEEMRGEERKWGGDRRRQARRGERRGDQEGGAGRAAETD